MKDEWDNECPYDFKNIQFKRWLVIDETEFQTFDGLYVSARITSYISDVYVDDEADFIWCYTFSSDWEGGIQDYMSYILLSHSPSSQLMALHLTRQIGFLTLNFVVLFLL